MSDQGIQSARQWGSAWGYAVSLALTAVVTLLGALIFSRGNITDLGLLYLVPVMFAATRYGLPTAVVTSLACSLAYNFFFIPPTHTFTVQEPQNFITILVLLGVALVTSQLAARVREQALVAQASSAQNSALADFAQQLTGIGTFDELTQVACPDIGQLMDANTVLLVPDRDRMAIRCSSPPGCQVETLDDAAARLAFDHNTPAGRGSDTLPAAEWLFYPLGTPAKARAVFGLSRSDARAPVLPDQLPLLERLLEQTGLALERIALEEEMANLVQIRDRDSLRQSLLSSVSHDLRTPLTTMLGTLKEMRALSPEQERQLATARAEAERLHRFVANLLDMVRIEAGSLRQSIEPVDLSEAVASAVHDLGAALREHPVRAEVSPDLPCVMADPQLFHHCLINLIENASKYGKQGAPIVVNAACDEQGLELSVEDEGPGIPTGEEERIFETFTRIEGSDRKGGTGLGLAIVKGFAEAMGLSVRAANRSDREGARFTIRFGHDQLRILSDE